MDNKELAGILIIGAVGLGALYFYEKSTTSVTSTSTTTVTSTSTFSSTSTLTSTTSTSATTTYTAPAFMSYPLSYTFSNGLDTSISSVGIEVYGGSGAMSAYVYANENRLEANASVSAPELEPITFYISKYSDMSNAIAIAQGVAFSSQDYGTDTASFVMTLSTLASKLGITLTQNSQYFYLCAVSPSFQLRSNVVNFFINESNVGVV